MQFNQDKQTVFKRLNYCKELLSIQESKSTTNPIRILKQKDSRIQVLRSILLGETVSQVTEIRASSFALKKLIQEELKNISNIEKPTIKLQAFLNLSDLIQGYRVNMRLGGGAIEPEINKLDDDIKFGIAEIEETLVNELADIEKSSPIQYGAFQDEILKVSDKLNRITEEEKQRRERINAEIEVEQTAVHEKYRDLIVLKSKAEIAKDFKTAQRLSDEASELLTTFGRKRSNLMVNDEYNRELDELAEVRKEIGLKIIQGLKDASTVTEADAQKWIDEKVTITKPVKNKMAKNNITEAEFINDLKQFYILTNGRLGRIKIDAKNHNRAFASNIQSYAEEGFVMLDNDFKQDTLFHELAHHLESDSFMRKMANTYVKSRSVDGGKRYYLKDLIPNANYSKKEIAYKTSFIHAYTGKIYKDGSTELLAMSAQYFYDPIKLVDVLSQDPSQIEFFISLMAQPKTELSELRKDYRDEILDNLEQVQSDLGDDVEGLFKKAVDLVTWSDAIRFDISRFTKDDLYALERLAVRDPIGRVKTPNGQEFLIFEADKVRYGSAYHGAGQKGYLAFDLREFIADENTGAMKASYFTYFTRLNFTTAFPIQTRDKDKAKVLIWSMSVFGSMYAHYKNSKGVIGEGFLNIDMLKSLLNSVERGS